MIQSTAVGGPRSLDSQSPGSYRSLRERHLGGSKPRSAGAVGGRNRNYHQMMPPPPDVRRINDDIAAIHAEVSQTHRSYSSVRRKSKEPRDPNQSPHRREMVSGSHIVEGPPRVVHEPIPPFNPHIVRANAGGSPLRMQHGPMTEDGLIDRILADSVDSPARRYGSLHGYPVRASPLRRSASHESRSGRSVHFAQPGSHWDT